MLSDEGGSSSGEETALAHAHAHAASGRTASGFKMTSVSSSPSPRIRREHSPAPGASANKTVACRSKVAAITVATRPRLGFCGILIMVGRVCFLVEFVAGPVDFQTIFKPWGIARTV